MSSEVLVPIEEVIKRAKKLGVDFKKADPYNRLRYYTKISLLPHMERRLGRDGGIKAYYPENAIAKLVKIEDLKRKGLSNDEILQKLEREDRSFTKVIKSYLNSRTLSIVLASILVLAVFLNSRGILNLASEDNLPADSENAQILESGVSTLKAGRHSTFVKSNKVTELSEIHIAFKNSYSPATTYYISEKVPSEGFVLSLDNQTANDVQFAWWLLQK